MAIGLVMSSCNKPEEKSVINQAAIAEISALPPGISWVIHHGSWSEWGRKSATPAFSGMGLCNYSGCWFCCINEEGVQVKCDTGYPTSTSTTGVVYIDPSTNNGFLIVQMNPDVTEENDAIQGQDQFYVDEDLESGGIIVKAGVYDFDLSIGDHGGYMINAEQI